MVFAHALEADIPHQHHFIVALGEKLLQMPAGIEVQTAANSSAYIRATRAGVSRSPSRSGSSPTASRISRTARSMRA